MRETPHAEPLVSVVLPTRNRMALLPDALASVRRQTYSNLEIVVVNDGSTDGTREFLRDLADEDERIRVIDRTVGGGAPAARNRGILASRGEFVAFQDDDTYWSPRKIERLVGAILTASPGVGFAYSPYESINLDGTRSVIAYSFSNDKYRGPWRVGTCSVIARRSALIAAGLFDEALPRVQDVDLWIRVLASTDYVFVPEILARTRRVEGGISANREALRTAIEAISEKHRSTSVLPRRDRAMMHYVLGHTLLLNNSWLDGVKQLFRAVKVDPTLVVGWATIGTAVLGPLPVRGATRIRAEIDRLRASDEQMPSP